MVAEEHEKPAMRRGRPGQWMKAALLGGVILGCGIIIGVVMAWRFLPRGDADLPRGPEHTPERIVQRLRHDLGLTDPQTEAVRGIIEQSHEKLETIRAKVEPEVAAQMEVVRGQVEAVLDPEQQVRWNERFREMRERFRPHRRAAASPDDAK